MLRSLTLLALPVLATQAAAQSVIIVDDIPGPGVDHATIQDGINAAGPSDVILVRAGSYAGFTIDGKGAKIIADVQGTAISDVITISNVGPSDEVVLNGFAITSVIGTALDVQACAGTVWLENLSIDSSGTPVFMVNDGARFTTCDSVVIADCAITSGGSLLAGANGGGNGLLAQLSNVWLYDTTVEGGTIAGSVPGAPGLSVSGGEAFASGCTFTGGRGGDGGLVGPFQVCEDGAVGGIGVNVTGNSLVRLFDSVGIGGPGGTSGGLGCSNGAQGPATFTGAGAQLIEQNPVFGSRSYEIPNPITSGQTGVLSWTGVPGELAWGVFSITQTPFYFPLFNGIYAPGAPQILLYVGTIPPSGQLDIPITVNLQPGKPFVFIWEQGLFYSLEDGFVLGTPRGSLILGQGL